MIEDKTKVIINTYVDEYLDRRRFDLIWIDHNREIQEIEPGKFVVQDTDIIIDPSQVDEEILIHPIEDFVVPEEVNLYVTECIVTLELPYLEEVSDFEDSGVVRSEDISIADPRISDDQLVYLIDQTCFYPGYQEKEPEVKAYLQSVYEEEHPLRIQECLNRIRPFLEV
jgi:hypothetical protein